MHLWPAMFGHAQLNSQSLAAADLFAPLIETETKAPAQSDGSNNTVRIFLQGALESAFATLCEE